MIRRLAPAFVLVAALAGVWVLDSGSREAGVAAAAKAPPIVIPMVDYDEQHAIEQDRAAVAAYLAAVDAENVRLYLDAMRPKITVDWARWQRLHQCEQADSWYAYGYFGNGLRGGGGLGMSDGAWTMAVNAARARGVELPGHVLQATPEEQMTAAQAFYDAYGWGWGCRV